MPGESWESHQELHENPAKRIFWQENHARKIPSCRLAPFERKPGRSYYRHTGIISMFIQFTLPAKTRIRFPDLEELMDTIIAIPVHHASGGVTSTVTPPVMSQEKMYNYCMSSRLRKRPVMEFSATATCSGVPLATTSPPPRPPSGPMSMI